MRRALLALVLLCGCTSRVWDPMEEQPKATPYAVDSLFPDQRAMRPIPAGTVAHGAPQGDEALRLGTRDGTYVPHSPVPLTPALLERGEKQFNVICAACHGVRGNGVSEVARKMSLRPPPSLLIAPARDLSDGQLFGAISQGYGLMQPMASWLSVEDRWAIVAYVRALQLSASVPSGELAPEDMNRLNEGKP